MRIIAISDTHTNCNNDVQELLEEDLKKLGGDDEETIIVHSGDISMRGTLHEVECFLDWYSNLPYKYKVFIAGNHDFLFEVYDDIEEKYKDRGVIYLKDKMVELDGIKIYGSPWQPYFYNWAFNLQRGKDIAEKWAMIPEGLDILLTHGPAYERLDDTSRNERVGCVDLLMRINEVKPKYHVCGHIHYGYGMRQVDSTTFINASVVNDRYNYHNKPVVFYI